MIEDINAKFVVKRSYRSAAGDAICGTSTGKLCDIIGAVKCEPKTGQHKLTFTRIKIKRETGVILTSNRAKATQVNKQTGKKKNAIESKIKMLGKITRTAKVTETAVKKKSKNDIEIMKCNRIELDKHHHNAQEILNCSNATPIRKHRGIGYTCGYCQEQYAKPADLKNHTIHEHNAEIPLFMKEKRWRSYYLKLDITALHCKLCDADVSTVEALIKHLTETHDKKIHTDIKQRIVAFKFEGEKLTCIICHSVFVHFKGLQEHMSIHFRNFVCETCDAGFITPGLLNQHSFTHKIGTYKCNTCHLVYDTITKKISHELTHKKEKKLNKCGYCNERFKENREKFKHLALVHGIEQPSIECQSCNKTFTSGLGLKRHMKRMHLMEKFHKCTECPMEFCTRTELAQHMLKHTGKKEFQCDVCLNTYARKYSIVEHMRIHNNDRRFKCEDCGQAFVQKCSWRAHLRSKHGKDV